MSIPQPAGAQLTGRLYGIGLGPGDPELLTVKAVRLIQAAPVVGYFAKAGRRGHARGIVDRWVTGDAEELPLHYPMTTEHAFDSPVYATVLAAFYADAVTAIAAHLDAGRDVALLSEGDPLFYGSFMHLFVRLRSRYPVTLVPGVTGMAGCWAAAAQTIAGPADRATPNHGRGSHHEARAKFRKSPNGGGGGRAAAAGNLR
jgi:precorrin-2/cobalt-factor-2 C20-methyltransferase